MQLGACGVYIRHLPRISVPSRGTSATSKTLISTSSILQNSPYLRQEKIYTPHTNLACTCHSFPVLSNSTYDTHSSFLLIIKDRHRGLLACRDNCGDAHQEDYESLQRLAMGAWPFLFFVGICYGSRSKHAKT